MKLLRKAAAVFIAAAISLCPFGAAFADTADEQAPSAAVDDDGGDAKKPDATVDVTDKEYTPIDKTEYIKWNADIKPEENKNYYIDSFTKIQGNKTVVFPKNSTLVLCEGANLQIYAGSVLYIYGKQIIEPKGRLTVTGTFSLKEGAGLENHGSIVTTKSSLMKFSSDFVNHNDGTVILSGKNYIYQDGNYINRGKTTVSSSAELSVTGNYTNTEESFLHQKGSFKVTISGTATMGGYYSLTGEVINSGKFVYEKTVQYFKGKQGRFAVTKSARLIDYRKDFVPGQVAVNLQNSGMKGVDVSSWQGAINWERVRASGVKFAMIRSSFGDEKTDKTFEYNITQAAQAGINVGVYHYCYAQNTKDARTEAKHFIETISPYEITFPVVLDLEDPSQSKLDKEEINAIARVFIEEIRKAGYYPMIYSYSNWFNDYMDMDKLDCEVWVAHWGVSAPTYSGNYSIWQYSCEGLVSGIDGFVDLNVCFKDYEKIIREGGYNNLE